MQFFPVKYRTYIFYIVQTFKKAPNILHFCSKLVINLPGTPGNVADLPGTTRSAFKLGVAVDLPGTLGNMFEQVVDLPGTHGNMFKLVVDLPGKRGNVFELVVDLPGTPGPMFKLVVHLALCSNWR